MMKVKKMSLQTRKELIKQIRSKYHQASWADKSKLLNGFIETTGYQRKYAIGVLNRKESKKVDISKRKTVKPRKYNEDVFQPLLTIWYAANQICAKRLAPFLPELIPVLERWGHLSVSPSVRTRLLTISPATIDRLLKVDRQKAKQGISTTRPGNLLKHQIQIRTFADWNDVIPGFFEADLVSQCGGRAEGSFLNTLVLTDISSGWTEFISLLSKNGEDVIAGIKYIQTVVPIILIGLDTDNGGEFINYELLKFCKENKITFTRGRPYRKNDQAHVEEKNGSIIRKLIGYDRYEGIASWRLLAEMYGVLRLYINFFQPSVKLVSKERRGSKVIKRYDKAQTPYQRLIASAHVSEEIKEKLKNEYALLDPVNLLKSLERHQDLVWKSAWKSVEEQGKENASQTINLEKAGYKKTRKVNSEDPKEAYQEIEKAEEFRPTARRYRRTKKPRIPRTWLTHKDAFETVWEELQAILDANPTETSTNLMDNLILKSPDFFHIGQLRTLQRRVANWRKNRLSYAETLKQ